MGFKKSFHLIGGRASSYAFGFFVTMAFAHYMPASEFGKYSIAQALIELISLVLVAGSSVVLARNVAASPKNIPLARSLFEEYKLGAIPAALVAVSICYYQNVQFSTREYLLIGVTCAVMAFYAQQLAIMKGLGRSGFLSIEYAVRAAVQLTFIGALLLYFDLKISFYLAGVISLTAILIGCFIAGTLINSETKKHPVRGKTAALGGFWPIAIVISSYFLRKGDLLIAGFLISVNSIATLKLGYLFSEVQYQFAQIQSISLAPRLSLVSFSREAVVSTIVESFKRNAVIASVLCIGGCVGGYAVNRFILQSVSFTEELYVLTGYFFIRSVISIHEQFLVLNLSNEDLRNQNIFDIIIKVASMLLTSLAGYPFVYAYIFLAVYEFVVIDYRVYSKLRLSIFQISFGASTRK